MSTIEISEAMSRRPCRWDLARPTWPSTVVADSCADERIWRKGTKLWAFWILRALSHLFLIFLGSERSLLSKTQRLKEKKRLEDLRSLRLNPRHSAFTMCLPVGTLNLCSLNSTEASSFACSAKLEVIQEAQAAKRTRREVEVSRRS